MRIRDVLLDFLNETALFKMAYRRRIAIDRVRDLQQEIADHLIKVIMYSDTMHINGWFNELNSWFDRIQNYRVKNNNMPLDQITLMNLLFKEPLGTVDDVQSVMNHLHKRMPELFITQFDCQIVHEQLYWILTNICSDISKNKFINISDYFKD
jgi:hypothetical protein